MKRRGPFLVLLSAVAVGIAAQCFVAQDQAVTPYEYVPLAAHADLTRLPYRTEGSGDAAQNLICVLLTPTTGICYEREVQGYGP